MTKITVNAYCTIKTPLELDFEHELNFVRDRSDRELIEHLEGFSEYIKLHGGEMNARLYALWRHTQRVQQHYSVDVELEQFMLMVNWGRTSNAIFFMPDGTIYNPLGQVLLSQSADEVDPDASVPYPDDALQRKETTEGFLSFRELEVTQALPPVISEGEVNFRSAEEVAKRALALFTVALRGASLAAGEGIALDDIKQRFPLSFNYLSPAEEAFLPAPDQQSSTQFAWRYETLAVLFWALGAIDELPFPEKICDVKTIIRIMAELDPDKFIKEAQLINHSKILDTLDMHFRVHWIVREASAKGQREPECLKAGVILERHHALNWLTRFEDADWDDVDTPT
ncbi:MAG: DUF4272 domain-containing protein [Methyloligellaceae bacterium]